MDISTNNLKWDVSQKKLTSGTIIYGGKEYPFEWKGSEYVINGKLNSVFEKQLLQALQNEFKPK